MSKEKSALGQKLLAWWKKATTEESSCMRCGHCSHVCKLAGLDSKDKQRDKAKGD